MSHKGRVKLTDRAMELAKKLLGANPTPARLEKLLEQMKETPMPLDEQDRDLGRTVHRSIQDPQKQREARERLEDRIAANRAMGLDPQAPPIEETAVETTPAGPRDFDSIDAATEAFKKAYTTPDPDIALAPAPVAPPAAPEPASEADAIEAAKSAGLRRVNEIAEALERKTLQRMPELRNAGRSLKSLDDAASVLIAELDLGDRDAIVQVCQEHGLANWVVLLGAVKRMADLQELNAGEFQDSWLNRQTTGGTPASSKQEMCVMCGGQIPPDPVRKNRIACCNKHGSGFAEHTAGCPLASLQMVKGKWVTVPVTA